MHCSGRQTAQELANLFRAIVDRVNRVRLGVRVGRLRVMVTLSVRVYYYLASYCAVLPQWQVQDFEEVDWSGDKPGARSRGGAPGDWLGNEAS